MIKRCSMPTMPRYAQGLGSQVPLGPNHEAVWQDGWSPPKYLTPPTLRGVPAAGAPACTAALTLGHLLREITQLAHFRLRPLSSLSDAESELLRDNDPGGLNLTTLVLEEAPQVSGRLVQKDPLGGGLGSWGWSKTPTNRQTVPFKLGKICPVRA